MPNFIKNLPREFFHSFVFHEIIAKMEDFFHIQKKILLYWRV
jgi:hypothetical protein